jgi:Flp pilus assembly pilin Flp
MVKLPDERGQGLIEWILIVILVIMVLVTIYFLLRPALVNLWQDMLQSIQQ